MTRIDLQDFLRRLNDDLWAAGRKKKLEDIVLHIVHPRVTYIPRQLICQNKYDENRYHYHPVLYPDTVEVWAILESCWDVVKVSRRRYPTGLKISILVHRAEGA